MSTYITNKILLLILSFIVVFISLFFMVNKAYIEPLETYQKTIDFLSDKYRDDEKVLHKKLFELTKEDDKEKVELAIIPKLLHKINDTCQKPDVIIRHLMPNEDNPFRFQLQFITNYFNFIKVLSEFEKLDIVIHHIDIKPYEISKNSPRHLMTLDIQAIQGAEELSSNVISFLKKEIAKKNKRNPFQRFAKLGKNIDRIIDLTWIHKLTSIGKINGKSIATINRKMYYIGDSFLDMEVIKIDPSTVTFKKKNQNGTTKYIIGFRLSKKNEQKDTNNNKIQNIRNNLPQGIRNEFRF